MRKPRPESGRGSGDANDEVGGTGRSRPVLTAYQRALGLLVRREHSRRELERKLTSRGVESGEALEAVQRLAGQGYQDEDRFAGSLARTRAAAGYGPVRIRAELGTHGLPEHVIGQAMDDLNADNDWRESAYDLLQRRFGEAPLTDPARRRKAQALLLRRGFPNELVWSLTSGAGID